MRDSPATPVPESFHHVTLTVTSLERSVEWYGRVLGIPKVADRFGDGWVRALLRAPSGLVIGLTQHDETPDGDRFDHRRVGLDHLSIGCPDRAGVLAWCHHLDALGIDHEPLVETPTASVMVCRDPDGVPVEFFGPT